MAQTVNFDSATLILPGSYPSITVQSSVAGLSTNGVVVLLGEADAGPDFSKEEDLQLNAFGADQQSSVLSKYRSGPLLDAYRAVATPANDTDIVGAPSRIILVKTNASAKASSALTKIGGGTYATLADKSYGKAGNLINYQITALSSEVIPTTGPFTYLPPIGAFAASFRANGDTAVSTTVSALTLPPAFVTQINALSGIAATGGADRLTLNAVSGNLAVNVVSGFAIQISYDLTWNVTPTAGDTLYIPSGSAIAGAGNANVGLYVVTEATDNTIDATKLHDATGSPGDNTSPVNVSSTPVAATSDLHCYAPVTISLEAGVVVDGLGKSLEINELTSSPDRFSDNAYALSTDRVTWISKTGSPTQLTSASEYEVQLNVNRQVDNIQESMTAGGDIALMMGYTGTSASAVLTDTTMTITVTGGSGSSLTIALADYPTLADLASYIASNTGYSASVGSAALGNLSPKLLDNGTFKFGTTFGNKTGRIKVDAYKFFKAISDNSQLVQLGTTTVAQAAAGLPDVNALKYLAGGTKGGTTDASFQAAVDALEAVQGNFIVPLMSRDASADISDGLTDSASTYTIAAIHAAIRSHVLKMSTLKRRRNRQGFLSIRDSFDNAKTTASNLAAARCTMAFQDVKNLSLTGIKQFHPWMGAALAAGMQAAGFYRPLTFKGINCSGALQAAGDFKDNDDTNMEDAILAGLLPIKRNDTGGFIWEIDQTTYTKDDNFVYNSVQAIYVADVVALTSALRMEKAFVGKSLAQLSASVILSAFENVMSDMVRLKLLAPSTDAPKGFKNATVKINGPVALIEAEIKLATELLFIPISFLVTQVQQSAG